MRQYQFERNFLIFSQRFLSISIESLQIFQTFRNYAILAIASLQIIKVRFEKRYD